VQALLNLVLTILLWIPGAVHALFVVHNHLADKRTDRLIKTVGKPSSSK